MLSERPTTELQENEDWVTTVLLYLVYSDYLRITSSPIFGKFKNTEAFF